MKGIEMPVNTLVVIAIAVLVMLGIIAMYMSGVGPFQVVIEMSAKGSSCNLLNAGACESSLRTIPMEFGNYENLENYCEAKYEQQFGEEPWGDLLENYCKAEICRCPGVDFEYIEQSDDLD